MAQRRPPSPDDGRPPDEAGPSPADSTPEGSGSFNLLVRQLLVGESIAENAIFARFSQRLIGLARTRLDARVAGRVDPEDVVQSVFRSFFLRARQGELHFRDPAQMWSLLVVLTVRKCQKQARRHLANRRDVRRERGGEADAPLVDEVVLDRDPDPEEAAALAETIEQVMRRLGSPVKQQVFQMSLQGYQVREIADQLGYYERGVLRVRAEIADILKKLLGS